MSTLNHADNPTPRESTLSVWRLIAQHMPAGMKSAEVQFHTPYSEMPYVRTRLSRLREMGFLACQGAGPAAVWRTTTKVPPGLWLPSGSVEPPPPPGARRGKAAAAAAAAVAATSARCDVPVKAAPGGEGQPEPGKRAATGPRPINLQLWHLVAEAMPKGLMAPEVLAGTHVSQQPDVKTRLSSLRKAGYLRCEGKARYALWRTTTKVPPGCELPPGSVEPGPVYVPPPPGAKRFAKHHQDEYDDDESDAPMQPRNPAPKGKPPGVPNSVWQLGDLAAGRA